LSRDDSDTSVHCAWRALYEELHVHEISEEMITNPLIFKSIGDKRGLPNVYISRLRENVMIRFTGADFNKRRQPYEKMKADNLPRHLWKPYLETKRMENLLIQPLLEQDPKAISFGVNAKFERLELRDVALKILRDEDVRKCLKDEVEKSKRRNGLI
jgi:hypothetical protein